MGIDFFEIVVNCLKLLMIFLFMVQAVPVLVWLERRGSAFIQNRFGPNRVGPLGLMQLLADAAKFLKKEDFAPLAAVRPLFFAAPVFALIPATLAYCAIPFSIPLSLDVFEMFGHQWGPYIFKMQGYEMNIGIVFILGISSLGAYTILMAGWGSGSKYSLLGALRASAQIISYELALGLSIVGLLLLYGTFNLTEMVMAQQGPLHFVLFGRSFDFAWLPNWGIFYQPLGFILFFAASFAESNRLPFDLAEGEAELVAGFHVEYGGFKMLMFFIGEYGHMMIASGLAATFFFGGFGIPVWTVVEVRAWLAGFFESPQMVEVMTMLIHLVSYLVKLGLFLWIFIQVRWTLPRFRYDQLMDLGWKTMLPWALGNTVVTALIIYLVS